MQSKLRAILGDRILVVLLLALLVQSYRVADQYGTTADRPPTVKELVDRLSEGGSIEIPLGDGGSTSISMPRGEDGKPIDIRPLFVEGGKHLEENYLKAEREYGPRDPRTMRARGGYAAVLLYRGERARAMELYQQNYDTAILAEDMTPAERLDQLLVSVTALGQGTGYDERLLRLLPVARAEAQQAPRQAAKILNKIANMYMDAADFDSACSHFRESARLPLDYENDKAVIAETQLGLTAALYKSGDIAEARETARQLLRTVISMPESDAMARDLYLSVLPKIFTRLQDPESLATLKLLAQRPTAN